MPELPEVETTVRGIRPHVVGRTLVGVCVHQPVLRYPVPENLPQILAQQRVVALSRRGKYLLMHCEGGHLLIHLGMSGCLRMQKTAQSLRKHDHLVWSFDHGEDLIFNDPRRFGLVLWTTDDPFEHRPGHLGGIAPLGRRRAPKRQRAD
jgi:formamidopyrimidine-DNA glycosylase